MRNQDRKYQVMDGDRVGAYMDSLNIFRPEYALFQQECLISHVIVYGRIKAASDISFWEYIEWQRTGGLVPELVNEDLELSALTEDIDYEIIA